MSNSQGSDGYSHCHNRCDRCRYDPWCPSMDEPPTDWETKEAELQAEGQELLTVERTSAECWRDGWFMERRVYRFEGYLTEYLVCPQCRQWERPERR